MGTNIAKLTESSRNALRIIKSVGPLIISQSKKASESYAEHCLRLAEVEAARRFLEAEAKSIAQVRSALRERFYDASPEDRIKIKKDISECESELRRLNIIHTALETVGPEKKNDSVSEFDVEAEEISPHWMDKFNEFSRARNEPWRQDLLAKSLALEAKQPGAIGPRALWFIGTMDEELFHAFASLLDLSTNIGGGYIIPQHTQFNDRPIPNCPLGEDRAIGHLTFMLSDLGLFGDVLSSYKTIPDNVQALAKYGSTRVVLQTKKPLTISGVIPTVLGATLARLYQPRPNVLGQEIFEAWMNNLNESQATKVHQG